MTDIISYCTRCTQRNTKHITTMTGRTTQRHITMPPRSCKNGCNNTRFEILYEVILNMYDVTCIECNTPAGMITAKRPYHTGDIIPLHNTPCPNCKGIHYGITAQVKQQQEPVMQEAAL